MIEGRETLAAAMDRLLPSDRGPGAATARAIAYTDWLAAQPAFERIRSPLTETLALLDRLAVARAGHPFAHASADDRDAVLQLLSGLPRAAARDGFWILLRLTLAGFLCDPRYGGNHQECGWRHIGFPGPHAS